MESLDIVTRFFRWLSGSGKRVVVVVIKSSFRPSLTWLVVRRTVLSGAPYNGVPTEAMYVVCLNRFPHSIWVVVVTQILRQELLFWSSKPFRMCERDNWKGCTQVAFLVHNVDYVHDFREGVIR